MSSALFTVYIAQRVDAFCTTSAGVYTLPAVFRPDGRVATVPEWQTMYRQNGHVDGSLNDSHGCYARMGPARGHQYEFIFMWCSGAQQVAPIGLPIPYSPPARLGPFSPLSVNTQRERPLILHILLMNSFRRTLRLYKWLDFNILPGWMMVSEKLICPGTGSIESVCFVGRTFSPHINGSVVISNVHSDAIRRVQVCPAPLWNCCAVIQSALVSYSDILYFFNLEEAVVEKRISLGVDSRLLSVASRNNQVAVEGQNVVFIIKAGQNRHQLVVALQDRRLPTIVWTVAFTKDNLVLSDDSCGKLFFWNSESGALLQQFPKRQKKLPRTGFEPARVLSYHRIISPTPSTPHSQPLSSRREHRCRRRRSANHDDPRSRFPQFPRHRKRNGPIRDVKALAACDDRVYAVGDDHEIYVGKQGCQIVKKQINKQAILGGRLAMVRGLNYVDLYTSGEGEEEAEGALNDQQMYHYVSRWIILPRNQLYIYSAEDNIVYDRDVEEFSP